MLLGKMNRRLHGDEPDPPSQPLEAMRRVNRSQIQQLVDAGAEDLMSDN